MRVTICGVPAFYIEMDKQTINVLMELSEAHYDAVCRQVGEVGGFLYGWHNEVEFGSEAEDDDYVSVRSMWDQVDVTLKLCEMAEYGKEEKREVARAYAKRMREALRVAEELADKWEHQTI